MEVNLAIFLINDIFLKSILIFFLRKYGKISILPRYCNEQRQQITTSISLSK